MFPSQVNIINQSLNSNTMKCHFNILRNVISLCLLMGLINSVSAGCLYNTELVATKKADGNHLSWSTENETNNQHFIIERSANGIDFEVAGKVNGAGSTKEIQEYSFSDLNKIKKYTRYFYRLVQVDFDGASEFSHVVVLTRTDEEKRFELTSLNSGIVDRYLNFNLNSKEKNELSYNLQTNMGEILLKGKVEVTKGDNAISLDLNDMETGRYQFAIRVKNETSVLQIKKVDSSELPAVNLATKNKN